MTAPSRQPQRPKLLAWALVLLSAGVLLSGCVVAVRPDGRCWHRGWRGPYGVWHAGFWGRCR